ncbi:MAG: bacteriophage Gp15 family protein [Bacilli bacterium]|nr:bacteriophage Gp15 family protein [Bacilli bacterium]
MNTLIEGLPKTVKVNGSPFLLNTNFYIGIIFTELMTDRNLSPYDKVIQAIKLWYKEPPPIGTNEEIKAAFDAIMWFYTMGEDEEEAKGVQSPSRIKQRPMRILDYEADQGYIVSAFQQQYSIDLTVENIHWWRFKMLFNGLTDKTKIVKIMQYRSMEIDPKMPEKQRKFYQEMKILYALPDKRTEEEKERDFQEQLNIALGGG